MCLVVGVEGVEAAESVAEAVQNLNENGYEVVSVTESGAPSDAVAWSNMCTSSDVGSGDVV